MTGGMTSLGAQLVKNPPAMQETPVHSWVGKIPLSRRGQPFPYSCLQNSKDGEDWWAIVQGVAKSHRTEHTRINNGKALTSFFRYSAATITIEQTTGSPVR